MPGFLKVTDQILNRTQLVKGTVKKHIQAVGTHHQAERRMALAESRETNRIGNYQCFRIRFTIIICIGNNKFATGLQFK